MSIPKEPRQIMINLMYIVLTAILALNVSAEILNAFLSMDKSINESSDIIGHSNNRLMDAIQEQAQAYNQFEPYWEKSQSVHQVAQEFYQYVGALKQELIDVSGGLDEDNQPKGMKDKDVTTRLLVIEGKGMELEREILKTRSNLLSFIEDEEQKRILEKSIPLDVDPIPDDSDKTSWAQFTFQQMPVAAVMPLLTKLQNDVKVAETSILGYFYKKTGAVPFKPDSFIPVVAANKGYLTVGENFNAELFLSAYSSTADNIRIQVDGRSVPVRNGKAIFNISPQSIGEKRHKMTISFTDPVSGAVERFEKEFFYEVGERSVTLAADKMNVFYVGVDNPISVSAAGVPSSTVKVTTTNGKIEKKSNGSYVVKPAQKGNAKVTVTGEGMDPIVFDYRVKTIPDPSILLGRKKSGSMKAGEFKVHPGIRPHLENFDFKATCRVMGFELTRKPRNSDVLSAVNSSGAYQGQAQRIVQMATPGDTYYFDKIKVKCPGDSHGRELNGMIFHIR